MKKLVLLVIFASSMTFASDNLVENFDSGIEFTEQKLIDFVLYENGDYRDSVWYATIGDDGVDCKTEFHSFKISEMNSLTDFTVTFNARQEYYPYGCGLPSECVARVQKTNNYQVEGSCEYIW